jgi:hypothetical protein
MSDQMYQIEEKLAELEGALLASTPNMPSLLRDIHRNLGRDPELVTMLSEEECSILVRGLKKQTNTEIATTALKASKSKAASKMTLSDL